MNIVTVAKSAQKKVNCNTWLEYWETHAHKKAAKCSVLGCDHPAEVGAQVYKPSLGQSVVHIVPLCAAHASEFQKPLEVAESTVLVLANKGYACED